jgi:hypothetical protein
MARRIAVDSNSEYYRRVFLIAAAWNVVMGLLLLFGENAMRAIAGVRIPFDPLGTQLFVGFVLVFGFGYYLVARDLTRNEGIVLLGIVGKLLAVSLFFIHAALGDISFFLAAPTAGDLVFAAMFAQFLWRGRQAPAGALSSAA